MINIPSQYLLDDNQIKAKLKIYKDSDKTVFEFSVFTPVLIRMKDLNRDNRVELSINSSKLYYFTASGLTNSPYDFQVKLLKNDNKGSLYKIFIFVKDQNIESFEAYFESIKLPL